MINTITVKQLEQLEAECPDLYLALEFDDEMLIT